MIKWIFQVNVTCSFQLKKTRVIIFRALIILFIIAQALAWCPWQSSLLASGGGTADRNIRFWNANTGVCLSSVDTKSQVRVYFFYKCECVTK